MARITLSGMGCPRRIARSADVAALGIAPDEAGLGRHLVDHRVARGAGMRSGITALGLAAADMAACRAQPQIEGAAALLAAIGLRPGGIVRDVLAGRLGRRG